MTDYTLHFAKSSIATVDLGNSTIAVWPINLKWNDFGYGFQAMARIRKSDFSESKKTLDFELYVVPVPLGVNRRFNTWVESLLSDQHIAQPHDLGAKFFTIMHKEESYKRLVAWVGNDTQELDRILLPLRDIVYFRKSGLETEEIRAFLREDGVIQGIFRSESTYLAWHRGWRILSGGNHELIPDAREAFSFSAHLTGFNSSHSLDIKFDAPAPLMDRCHALIGRNGTGKSRLLRELIICLGQNATKSDTELFLKNGKAASTNVVTFPEQTRFNRVLVLTWDSHSQLPDGVRMDAPFEYLHFQMSAPPDGAPSNELDVSVTNSDRLTPLLLQMLREPFGENDDPWKNLRETLKPIFDLNDIAVASLSESGTQTEWVTVGKLRRGSEQTKLTALGRVIEDINPAMLSADNLPIALSSGERMFLNFGIRCVARMIKGSLVILDEPETHLHPNLISDFMRVLAKLLEVNKSIALIATHSPFVVRELPSRCVHVFSIDEDTNPSINSAYLRTLGASIDRLSIDIFGDAESEQLNLELAKSIANSDRSFDDILAEFGQELSSEMLSLVRELMTKDMQPDA